MENHPTLLRVILAGFVLFALCLYPAAATGQQEQTEQQALQAQQKPQDPASGAAAQPEINKQSPQQDEEGKRGSRVFGIMPNQLTVEGAAKVKPISAGEKFKLVAEGAFDPYEFVVVGILAGIGQANNDIPQWGQGAKGYAIRYAADLGDLVDGNFMVGAILPSLLHQDPRYFQSGKGNFWRRTGYAMSRIVVTRGDNGKKQFNFSEIGGNAVAGAISNTYRPPSERSLGTSAQTWGTQLLVDMAGFELKEFWPDIRHRFSKKKSVK